VFLVFPASDDKFTILPLVFALGGLALLLKSVFLLRKSSAGLGLSQHDLAQLSDPSNRKPLPSIAGKPRKLFTTLVPADCCCGQFAMLAKTSMAPGIILLVLG
jgi:hypothetical protein